MQSIEIGEEYLSVGLLFIIYLGSHVDILSIWLRVINNIIR